MTNEELDTIEKGISGAVMMTPKMLLLDLIAQAREANRLRAAITEHHAQKADDRCWMDDMALYDAAGLQAVPIAEHFGVGDKEAMLANCKRYIESRCVKGEWKSYRELEDELARQQPLLRPSGQAVRQAVLGV